jgi:hypothetical protein
MIVNCLFNCISMKDMKFLSIVIVHKQNYLIDQILIQSAHLGATEVRLIGYSFELEKASSDHKNEISVDFPYLNLRKRYENR